MWTLLLILQETGRSRTVAHVEGRAIEVAVPISTGDRHVATVVSFPEESLEAIVAGWNENDISLERRRENLFIKLLRKAEGDLHVVGAGGTLYRIYVRPAGKDFDGIVRITRPAGAKGKLGSVDLARAMRLGAVPDGVTVRAADRVLWQRDGSAARVKYVYDATFYRGYVIELSVASSCRLDLSRFVSKDLVVVGARDLVIEANGTTLLYLVFWK